MGNEMVSYEEKVGALSITDVRSQVNLIQQVMRDVMQKDEHYGVIPGTGTKPTLLKAGAEKLCLTFRLAPDYEIDEKREGKHLTVTVKCVLTHIPTGNRFGSGVGSCSTYESKYYWRTGKRLCPQCGADAIIKGREEYGGGWICFAKKGGCGAKFLERDVSITGQDVGRVPNEDVPDAWNTVIKMGCKRALVAAVLNATAASDIFTQDIEDMPVVAPPAAPEKEINPVKASPPKETKVTAVDREAIHVALSQNDVTLEELLDGSDYKRLEDAPSTQTPKMIAWIKAHGAAKKGKGAKNKNPVADIKDDLPAGMKAL